MRLRRSSLVLPRLPARLVPIHLANKVRGAAGPNGTRIWATGTAPFGPGPITAALRLDAPGGHHGTVCPAYSMPLATLQQELANTRDSWDIDEP